MNVVSETIKKFTADGVYLADDPSPTYAGVFTLFIIIKFLF